jgi:hypothetical protein
MLFSRKTITTFLALGLLALAPLGAVRADDAEAPKKGDSPVELKLRDLKPGKGKGKIPLLRRVSERRAKKSGQSPAQPTSQQATPK